MILAVMHDAKTESVLHASVNIINNGGCTLYNTKDNKNEAYTYKWKPPK